MRRSAFVDLVPQAKASGAQLSQADATLTGVVRGIVDQANGLVEVQVDGAPDEAGTVVVAADAGFMYPGARVRLPRDSSGRVQGVREPVGEVPDGVEVVALGESARRIVAAETQIEEARTETAASLERVNAAVKQATDGVAANLAKANEYAKALEERQREAEAQASRIGTLEGSVSDLNTEVVETRKKAAEAAAKAAAALFSDLWPNRYFEAGGPLLGKASDVVPPYGQARFWDGRDTFGSWQTVTGGSVYRVSITAKRVAGALGLRVGFHTNTSMASGGADNFVQATEPLTVDESGGVDLGDGWRRYVTFVKIVDAAKRARVWIGINQGLANTPALGSTQWLFADLQIENVTEAFNAQKAADAADAKALAAQASADRATGAATTASKQVQSQPRKPAAADGQGVPTGGMWFEVSGDEIKSAWRWSGTAWVQEKIGADGVKPGVFTSVHAAQGFLSNLEVGHGKLTAANIGSVNVGDLVVTNGATIPSAVMKVLLADEAFLKALLAERISVAGGCEFPDPLIQDTTSWKGAGDITLAPAGAPGNALTITANGKQRGAYYQPEGYADASMTLEPGATYRLSGLVWFAMESGAARACDAYMRYVDSTGKTKTVNLTNGLQTSVSGEASSPTRFETQFQMPSDSRDGKCTIGLYVQASMKSGTVSFADVRVVRAAGSTLIEPGAVTTPKLAAGAVDATAINARSVAGAVGEFLKVSTQNLIAGNATVTNEMIVNELVGKLIRGSVFEMTDATGSGSILLALNAENKAAITVTTKNGGTAVLTSDGLDYYERGVLVGSQSWRALISPPMAILEWPANYGPNAGSGLYQNLSAAGATAKTLEGGAAIDGMWLQVPFAGWYQVDVSCGFLWASASAGWAVATSVWRESDFKAGKNPRDLEDPAMTLPLIPSVTTRPVASGVMKLDAGEKIAACFWQNTGGWKPNSGTSRMVVRLVDEI